MAVAVVDSLEVVEVDQAEAQRHAGLVRGHELTLQPFVEMAVISQTGQGIGQRETHRAQGSVRGALVERDCDQRTD